MRRMRMLARAVCAGILLVPAGVASAAAPPRACTLAEQAGSQAPVTIENGNGGSPAEDFLLVNTTYTAVVVQELGIPDDGDVVDDSVTVTGPPGLTLTPVRVGRRPAYRFRTTTTGTLKLDVAWTIKLRLGGTCRASGSVSAPVRRPASVTVSKARYVRGRSIFENDFWYFAVRAPGLADTRRVTIDLRFRRNSTVPPSLRSRVVSRATLEPELDGDALHTRRDLSDRALNPLAFTEVEGFLFSGDAPANTRYVSIHPSGNLPVGRRFSFSFSFEVRQAGRRIGGMRGGASCVRIQGRGRSYMRCNSVRFAARP